SRPSWFCFLLDCRLLTSTSPAAPSSHQRPPLRSPPSPAVFQRVPKLEPLQHDRSLPKTRWSFPAAEFPSSCAVHFPASRECPYFLSRTHAHSRGPAPCAPRQS